MKTKKCVWDVTNLSIKQIKLISKIYDGAMLNAHLENREGRVMLNFALLGDDGK